MTEWLQSWYGGYFQYHAVPRNEGPLKAFRYEVLRWGGGSFVGGVNVPAGPGTAFGSNSAICYRQSRSCIRIRKCALR